jgi:hypothetical protein
LDRFGDSADSSFFAPRALEVTLSLLSTGIDVGGFIDLSGLSNLPGRHQVPKCAPTGNMRIRMALLAGTPRGLSD